jgi:hypothetical protein
VGAEPLLAKHPPSDEVLGGETGDGTLGKDEVATITEEGERLLFGEVEDVVRAGEGAPER